MNPHFHTDFSISDSLIFVRKSVLIYETIIDNPKTQKGGEVIIPDFGGGKGLGNAA